MPLTHIYLPENASACWWVSSYSFHLQWSDGGFGGWEGHPTLIYHRHKTFISEVAYVRLMQACINRVKPYWTGCFYPPVELTWNYYDDDEYQRHQEKQLASKQLVSGGRLSAEGQDVWVNTYTVCTITLLKGVNLVRSAALERVLRKGGGAESPCFKYK